MALVIVLWWVSQREGKLHCDRWQLAGVKLAESQRIIVHERS
jgi:hypothetical protein